MGIQDIFKAIKIAQDAVGSAKTLFTDLKASGTVITQANEEELEREIAKLEAVLPELRASTQKKLRG